MSSGIRELTAALSTAAHDARLLEFLKALKTEQLPSAAEIHHWTSHSLAPFGAAAVDLADRLVRIVARSKHAGHAARSSHTRASLMAQLEQEGFAAELFVEAGLAVSSRRLGAEFWRDFRTEVVRSLRSFRVYGLEVEQAVYADLPSLFVAPRLRCLMEAPVTGAAHSDEHYQERDWDEEHILDDEHHLKDEMFRRGPRDDPERERDLTAVLGGTRRLVLVGGQGSGKTTVLRWLAVIAALDDEEGRAIRQQFGLPTTPCRPLLVRFRRLAERIRARGLEGVAGRVGLVASASRGSGTARYGSRGATR